MEIQVIGAHQLESAGFRQTAFLVDGVLAIDAGSLSSGLTLNHQRSLVGLLITHYHFDHIRDIPLLGLNVWGHSTLHIHTPAVVRDAVKTHILNDVIWPDLERFPDSEHPAVRFHTLEAGSATNIDKYRVTAVDVPHTVPTVGYRVENGGRSLFYTSDLGGGKPSVWDLPTDHLFVEVTFPNRMDDVAQTARHLTPERLRAELEVYRSRHGALPPVTAVHVAPEHQSEIAAELELLSARLDTPIAIAGDGEIFRI